MEGLVREAEELLKEDSENVVKDGGLIAESGRIEHYEISGYSTAARYAEEPGNSEIASKLKNSQRGIQSERPAPRNGRRPLKINIYI